MFYDIMILHLKHSQIYYNKVINYVTYSHIYANFNASNLSIVNVSNQLVGNQNRASDFLKKQRDRR